MSAPIETLAALIRPPVRATPAAVQAHLDALTKPPGSLGELERLALRLALIYGDPPPRFARPVVFVLAGDHGIAARGVSAYPRAVTAQMCRNYVCGGAAINTIAHTVGAELVVADFGVDADLGDLPGLAHRKVRRGSRDFVDESALTAEEVEAAVLGGAALVQQHHPPPDIVALGEMGIGNTTAASAITAALTGASVKDVVGPGTGVTGLRLAHKRRVVEQALLRLTGPADAITVLREVGGLEIAGLVGVTLGAGAKGLAVVLDGFISTAAALVAARLAPAVSAYCFAGHRSPEPGHSVLLKALQLTPILDLELRLGEGTGAALALPVLASAAALLSQMATFAGAGVATASERPECR